MVPKDRIASIPTVSLDGAPGTLDLRQLRTVVAVVHPRCESCREIIATLRPDPALRVLSVAPLAETRTMAAHHGLTAVTRLLGAPFHVYPQVVRTCAAIAECR